MRCHGCGKSLGSNDFYKMTVTEKTSTGARRTTRYSRLCKYCLPERAEIMKFRSNKNVNTQTHDKNSIYNRFMRIPEIRNRASNVDPGRPGVNTEGFDDHAGREFIRILEENLSNGGKYYSGEMEIRLRPRGKRGPI